MLGVEDWCLGTTGLEDIFTEMNGRFLTYLCIYFLIPTRT